MNLKKKLLATIEKVNNHNGNLHVADVENYLADAGVEAEEVLMLSRGVQSKAYVLWADDGVTAEGVKKMKTIGYGDLVQVTNALRSFIPCDKTYLVQNVDFAEKTGVFNAQSEQEALELAIDATDVIQANPMTDATWEFVTEAHGHWQVTDLESVRGWIRN